MKRNAKFNWINRKNQWFYLLLMCILMLSVGFASFSQDLKIIFGGQVTGVEAYYYNNGYFYISEQNAKVEYNPVSDKDKLKITTMSGMFSYISTAANGSDKNYFIYMMTPYTVTSDEIVVTGANIGIRRYSTNKDGSLFSIPNGLSFTVYANQNGSIVFDGTSVSIESENILGGVFHNEGTLTIGNTVGGKNNIKIYNSISYGGAIYNSGTLSVTYVDITNNSNPASSNTKTICVGGIDNTSSGICSLNNVNITGNKSTATNSYSNNVDANGAGGIYYANTNSEIVLSGVVKIEGNTDFVNNPSNVYLYSKTNTLSTSVDAEAKFNAQNLDLTSSKIGITTRVKPRKVTINIIVTITLYTIKPNVATVTNVNNTSGCFFSDKDGYSLGQGSNNTTLALQPSS